MRLVVQTPIGDGFSFPMETKPSCQLWKVKNYICKSMNLQSETLCFMLHGKVIPEDVRVGELKMEDLDDLALMPIGIIAAIDEAELLKEYNYLKNQFPLVKMVDLMTYTGKLRCERGYVKELADRSVWPFVEYVRWHEFKMTLSYLHPYKPPTVTWLTDISHPNIIPHKRGKVCVSILGKKWLPNTKLAAVINALYFLLSDPNPYSAYKTKKCQEVAKICRMFGFPLKRG